MKNTKPPQLATGKFRRFIDWLAGFKYIWWCIPRFARIILIASAITAPLVFCVFIGIVIHPLVGMAILVVSYLSFALWMCAD